MDLLKKILFVFIILYSASNKGQDALQISSYEFESNSGKKVQAELGTFLVQENRSKPNSRFIKLSFVRFKSTNPNPGNPIVYLAGGPGGSGINTAKGPRFELFMELRKIADVIAFDQRGTGLSNQIPPCASQPKFAIDIPGSKKDYIVKISESAQKCIDFWRTQGVEIEGYNTVENASDLEELRKVIGASKINLWGISYGSHLAFNYIKRFESSIDKVVMAGLEGPDHTIKLPKYNQNFLKLLDKKIKEDEKAAKAYPDLLILMKEVLNKLEKEPVYTSYVDPRSGKEITIGISKFDIQLATSYFLTKNPENWIRLPYLYQKMKEGDFSAVAQLVFILKNYAGQIRAMPLVMDAMSGVSNKRWKKIEAQARKSLLGTSTNFPFPYIAKKLDLPDLGSSFRKNPVTNVPVLFFSGSLDGRTYMESAQELVKGFNNCKHIIIEGAGHDMYVSTPKVIQTMLNFYSNEDVILKKIEIETPKFIVENNK